MPPRARAEGQARTKRLTKQRGADYRRPVIEVGVHEAKTHLSRLLRQVAEGEAVTIVRDGEPVARLVPIRRSREHVFGMDNGLYNVPDDFNDPLPELEQHFT